MATDDLELQEPAAILFIWQYSGFSTSGAKNSFGTYNNIIKKISDPMSHHEVDCNEIDSSLNA